jgi:hypothetical protein
MAISTIYYQLGIIITTTTTDTLGETMIPYQVLRVLLSKQMWLEYA